MAGRFFTFDKLLKFLCLAAMLFVHAIACSEPVDQPVAPTVAGTQQTAAASRDPVSPLSYPFKPMFTLTPFDPTATPGARPIPALSEGAKVRQTPALPTWIESVWPAPGTQVPLREATSICIRPATIFLDELYPRLLEIFNAGERARDHLRLQVNRYVPSELTWQEIIRPNSTNPGTAWVGTWIYEEFCWPIQIIPGKHQVWLTYPAGSGSKRYYWAFTAEED